MKKINENNMLFIHGGINCFAVGLIGWLRFQIPTLGYVQIAEAAYCWNT